MAIKKLYLFLFLLPHCGPHPNQALIGTSDFVPASPAYLPALGSLDGRCTVAHLGGGLGVTAGHCVDPVPPKKVLWGDGAISIVEKVLAWEQTDSSDLGWIQLLDPPKAHLDLRDSGPLPGETIQVLSFPKNNPILQSSGFCQIEAFDLIPITEQIAYTCDSMPGSSGGAILDSEKKLIGIHSFYSPMTNQNGGTPLSSKSKFIFFIRQSDI
jgi:hypothetical protein